MLIVEAKEAELRIGLGASDTTLVLNKFVRSKNDSEGNEVNLVMADFGTEGVISIHNGGISETIVFTAIATASNGTATLTIKASNGRNIDSVSPWAGYSTGISFPAGSKATIANSGRTMSQFLQKGLDATVTANRVFNNFPTKSGTLTPTDADEFITKSYADGLSLAGADVTNTRDSFIAGEALSAGKVVYIKKTDGKAYNAISTNSEVAEAGSTIGITEAAATEDTAVSVVLDGNVVYEGTNALSLGSFYYISNSTNGEITSTKPSTDAILIGVGIKQTGTDKIIRLLRAAPGNNIDGTAMVSLDERAALAGSAGTPGADNKFLSQEDAPATPAEGRLSRYGVGGKFPGSVLPDEARYLIRSLASETVQYDGTEEYLPTSNNTIEPEDYPAVEFTVKIKGSIRVTLEYKHATTAFQSGRTTAYYYGKPTTSGLTGLSQANGFEGISTEYRSFTFSLNVEIGDKVRFMLGNYNIGGANGIGSGIRNVKIKYTRTLIDQSTPPTPSVNLP